MHFFVFFVVSLREVVRLQRVGRGGAAGFRRRVVCALRRLLRLCRHYSRFACITSAEPTSPHQRCWLNTVHLVGLLGFFAEDGD